MKGLQEFIKQLEAEDRSLVLRIDDELNPANFEVSCYLKLLEERGNSAVTIFENVKNVRGETSVFPLVYNLFATRALCARAIGEPASNDGMGLGLRFGEIEKTPGEVRVITTAEAPVMQNVLTGDKADVTILPAAHYHEKDAGNYFDMACLMKAKSGDFYDVTPTKNMIHDQSHMSVSAHGHHHLARINREYEAAGEDTPVVVVVGHHPSFYLGSCALTPYGTNDYALIAGYNREPFRVVPSATLGSDFLVPADAEIIIEGFIPCGKKEYQNPFGEISGHYQNRMLSPQMEVTAICYRDNAIMEGIYPGHAEHINLGGVPKEGSTYFSVKKVVPDVTAVHLAHSGMGRFSTYISMKKRDYRDVTVAGMIAAAEVQNMKLVVVVDDDVNVFDEKEVMWAVATQCRWDKDLRVIPKVQSFRKWLGDAIAIIDATHHEDVENYPERNRLNAVVLEEIRNKYFNK
jgi:2,5-furandicarboxylate decarboxylase 1